MPHLTLTLLGAFQARLDNQPLTTFHSAKVQGLLAYLAVEGTLPHARESLMALFWPDDAPQSAQQSLRQALYALRRTLGDADNQTGEPFLLVTRQTVQFNPAAAYTLDVATFLQQAQQGNPEQAANLYTAELLTGLTTDSAPFEEWLRTTRQYLHNLALNTLHQLTQQRLDHSDYRQAALYARRQLTLEPWREEAHRQVMTALALSEERSAALVQYEICRRVLADELGVEPAAETTTLYTQIRVGKLNGPMTIQPPVHGGLGGKEPPQATTPATPRHNLPPQPTPFIGRQTDLEQIAARLQDPTCRLLTIVGPGGMGKTRLAIQAAQAILDSDKTPQNNPKSKIVRLSAHAEVQNPKFEDGVFFVALAGVGSPDLLISAIAAALDFTFYGSGDPKTQLLDYLRTKSLLLLLDNCEHLLDGIELVSDLLATAPKLNVLATSREPLNLREEWLHPLAGLRFPGDGRAVDATETDQLEQFTAIQLFIQCARRMKPSFDLTAEDDAVAQICRLVDGMPLAIELAATWLKFYSCAQIAEKVVRNLDLLTTKLRNVSPRHRSMKAVFEHSWALLSDQEQQTLQRLSVFRGGFDRTAAEQVADTTFPLLVALAEKSLIQVAPNERCQMHELLRQFAEEKLCTTPNVAEATRDCHCMYYLAFLEAQENSLKGQEQRAAVTAIEIENENIHSAWQWAIAKQNIDSMEQALESLYLFYLFKCRYEEGEMTFQQAATAVTMMQPSGRQGVLWAKLLARQGSMTSWSIMRSGNGAAAQKSAVLYQQSLAILQQLDVREESGFALAGLCAYFRDLGDISQALTVGHQALAIFTEQNDLWGIRFMLNELGFIYCGAGRYQEALQYYQQGLVLCEQRGDLMYRADTLNGIGTAQKGLGNYAAAKRAAQAALAVRTEAQDQHGIAWSLRLLSEIALQMNDYVAAQGYAQESLVLYQKMGLTQISNLALNNLGMIACARGDYRQAGIYFQKALTFYLETNTLYAFFAVAETLIGTAIVLGQAGKISIAIEVLNQVLVHPAAWQATKDRAAQMRAELERLTVEAADAAQAHANTQDLAALVTRLLTEAQTTNS